MKNYDEISKFIYSICIQEIKEGQIDATEAFIYANKASEYFDTIVTNLRPIIASKQIQKGGLKLYDAEIIEKTQEIVEKTQEEEAPSKKPRTTGGKKSKKSAKKYSKKSSKKSRKSRKNKH